MKRKEFLRSAALLAALSLLMSGTGMLFRVWLARRIGAAGAGLYQLTLSTGGLWATLAVSGIRFTALRLVSEELGKGALRNVDPVMRRCLAYAAVCGLGAGALLWSRAEAIGFLWLKDARAVPSLRAAALSLPCIPLCAALSGYFTACGRAWQAALIHLTEHLCAFLFAACFLSRADPADLAQCCAAVTLGQSAADLLALLLMAAAYLCRRGQPVGVSGRSRGLTARMLHTALPLALSAGAQSALRAAEQTAVPRSLRAGGWSADRALAAYGVIQGMSMPILCFPACLPLAASELIVPALTEAQMRSQQDTIRKTAGEYLRLCLLYSLAVSGFLWICADLLGGLLLRSLDCARTLRMLAPLVPFLYTDIAADGCLKGLGQQLWRMGVKLAEAALGLLLILCLLPRCGVAAYIGMLYSCEIFSLSLSLLRLRRCLRGGPSSARHSCGGSEKCAYKAGKSAGRPRRP